MKEERKAPEAIASAIAGRIDQEWEEGMKRNELKKKIGKEYGISLATVQKYLRLLKLSPTLLCLVNEGRLSIYAGAELSFLTLDNQEMTGEYIRDTKRFLSVAEAMRIKEAGQKRLLCKAQIDEICENKISVSILYGRMEDNSDEKMISIEQLYENISEILEKWKKYKEPGA